MSEPAIVNEPGYRERTPSPAVGPNLFGRGVSRARDGRVQKRRRSNSRSLIEGRPARFLTGIPDNGYIVSGMTERISNHRYALRPIEAHCNSVTTATR